jgi:hypothetical protein
MRERTRALLFHVLLGLCVALLAALATRLAWEADWSQHGRNRVQAATAALLQQLDAPLELTAYAPDQAVFRAGIEALVERLRRAGGRVALAFVDPVREPERARAAGVRRPGELVLRYAGREEHLPRADEATLASALARLVRTGSPWLVALRGHGERDLLGSADTDLGQFGRLLETQGFRLVALSLTETPQIPDNTAALIVAAPDQDLNAAEQRRLADWLEHGGALLWLAERPLPEALAQRLGLATLPGRVVDAAAADAGLDDPTVAVSARHPAHPSLGTVEAPLLFPGALAWEETAQEDWRTWQLAASSPRSWNETGTVRGRVAREAAAGERAGPLPLALAFTRAHATGEQRVAVVGDVDWLSDAWLGRGANRQFGVGLVRWLTAQHGLLEAPLAEPPDQRIAWSPALGGAAAVLWLLLAPLGLALTGLWVRAHRRRG